MDTALEQGDGMAEYRRIWRSRTPMARLGTQGELNGAIVMLASDASFFIIGSDITIDGAISAVI